MNAFIAIAAVMTLLVIAWLAYPLWRQKSGSGISSERLNAEIHRDQLKALENDLARGVISQQDLKPAATSYSCACSTIPKATRHRKARNHTVF